MENIGIFLTNWSIFRPLEISFGHLVYFVVIWYISPRFGILYQEKSGNPGVYYRWVGLWPKLGFFIDFVVPKPYKPNKSLNYLVIVSCQKKPKPDR
jgi:hypothetical protein